MIFQKLSTDQQGVCQNQHASYSLNSKCWRSLGRWPLFFLPEIVAQIWLDPLRGFRGHWATFINNFFQKIHFFMLFWAPRRVFLTSNSLNDLGGQKKHTHVKTPWILNKVSENKFFVGCMVWSWCWYHQDPNYIHRFL